jgi:hypothetical protein
LYNMYCVLKLWFSPDWNPNKKPKRGAETTFPFQK